MGVPPYNQESLEKLKKTIKANKKEEFEEDPKSIKSLWEELSRKKENTSLKNFI